MIGVARHFDFADFVETLSLIVLGICGLYLLSIPYRAALGWLWGVAEYVFEPAPENFGYVLELFFLGWNR